MKYWIAGLTALVASCIVTPSAHAVDVCGYTATGVQGVNCPVRNGQTVCLSVSTAIGPCDTDVECFGGPGFFCRATLIAKSGPEAQCPFSSVRPRGFNCFAKRLLVNPTRTPTGPPSRNRDRDLHADGYAGGRNTDADRHGSGRRDGDRYARGHCDRYARADPDGNRDRNADGYRRCDGDRYAAGGDPDRNRDRGPARNRDRDRHRHADRHGGRIARAALLIARSDVVYRAQGSAACAAPSALFFLTLRDLRALTARLFSGRQGDAHSPLSSPAQRMARCGTSIDTRSYAMLRT